jgi:hypothetical protein
MKGIMGTRGLAALIVSITAMVVLAAGASAASAAGPVTRTFSLIKQPNSKTYTVVSIDGLTINARCNQSGNPVVFAFSSATNGDLFGRLYDGLGRLHIIHNTSFSKSKSNKGVQLSPSAGSDFDSSGTFLYENARGQTVTVNIAFDDSTTLNKLNVCTVFGSLIAT